MATAGDRSRRLTARGTCNGSISVLFAGAMLSFVTIAGCSNNKTLSDDAGFTIQVGDKLDDVKKKLLANKATVSPTGVGYTVDPVWTYSLSQDNYRLPNGMTLRIWSRKNKNETDEMFNVSEISIYDSDPLLRLLDNDSLAGKSQAQYPIDRLSYSNGVVDIAFHVDPDLIESSGVVTSRQENDVIQASDNYLYIGMRRATAEKFFAKHNITLEVPKESDVKDLSAKEWKLCHLKHMDVFIAFDTQKDCVGSIVYKVGDPEEKGRPGSSRPAFVGYHIINNSCRAQATSGH